MIPQIQPWISESELAEVTAVIQSTYITEGAVTKAFEEQIKLLTGARYCVSVCNGTAGLYVGLKALGIGPGHEVIVPDMTFIATANAVIMAGATPVFCDVDDKSFCLDVNQIEKYITPKTKAIIPVDLYGLSADIETINQIAKKNSLYVIEDAAQGVGVLRNGKHVGTVCDIGVLSFYGNKTITTAEGGCILTNDKTLATECYKLKNHGRSKKGTFVHEAIGFNFAFTDLQAAIGVAQLKKLQKIKDKKARIRTRYRKNLESCGVAFTTDQCSTDSVHWFTSILCKEREALQKFLMDEGIQTRRAFMPLHLQPCYQNCDVARWESSDLVNSKWLYDNLVSLPSSYELRDEEIDSISDKIKEFYENRV